MPTAAVGRLPGRGSSFHSDSEETRVFYQGRLGLFAGWVFLVSGGFYVVNTVLRLAARSVEPTPLLLWTPQLVHLAATLVAGAVWLACRRSALELRWLRRLDAATTIALATGYALMGTTFALDEGERVMAIEPRHAIMVGLLACTYVVLARAAILPSAPGRTLWISAAAMLPIVGLNGYVLARVGTQGVLLVVGSLDIATWGVAGVAMAGLSSHIIYGLRAEAAKVRRLGQYTLEEKIGEGGMGIVYRAHHAMLRRPTAIKLLPPDRVGEASIRRFEREVQLTARLTHPNTIAVFDYGRTPDGLFYYAMEYLDGLNFDQLVREDGPQAPGRVIHLLHQTCGALSEAHGIGLVHGDVKPANLLLVDRGGVPDVVKVVDFGLVKQVDAMGTDATMTVPPGTIVQGTPLYLAPEVVKGGQFLEARSDLYAVGAVGYFLLTGRPVFEADTVVEIFAHHLHTEPVPPSQRTTRPIPEALETLILQCLKKDPAERPRDARSLQAALECCPCRVPWSSDDAVGWWAAFRARQRPTAPADPGGQPTLAVDVGDRMAI